ncbi:MAG: hypothetical protein R6V54_10090, partial [Desulfobacteraceae bacterium]
AQNRYGQNPEPAASASDLAPRLRPILRCGRFDDHGPAMPVIYDARPALLTRQQPRPGGYTSLPPSLLAAFSLILCFFFAMRNRLFGLDPNFGSINGVFARQKKFAKKLDTGIPST